jgi:nucleoside-diphosphate-sugar epimerase
VLNEFINGEGADKYKLRATVRNKSNQAKMKPLIDYFGDKLASVEFFNADLCDPNSIDIAVKGCDFVIHTASPVTINNPRDHDDVIGPAVSGVKNVLEAA